MDYGDDMDSTCPIPPTSPEQIPCLTASQLLYLYGTGDLTPTDVTQAYIARIEAVDEHINAYTNQTFDLALEHAAISDERWQRGRPRPLEGIPTAIKDLVDFLAGVRSTFGSLIFAELVEFIPPTNAIYVDYMIQAGCVPLGKVNTPEWGHRGITDNLAFGPTSTPFNLDYNAGGSSGGSSAALAAGMAALSQGSDAGGSVRIPAAMSGIVGMKMTFGRIPQNLPVSSHSPFLHPGPMAKTVLDTALLADVMAQPWSMDPFCHETKPSYREAVSRSIRGYRIAFSPNFDIFPVQDEIAGIVSSAAGALCSEGAIVTEPDSLGFDQITRIGTSDPITHTDTETLWIQQASAFFAHVNDFLSQPDDEGNPGLDMRDFPGMVSPEFMQLMNDGYDMSVVDWRRGEFLRFNGTSGYNGINYMMETVLTEYDFIITPTIAVDGVANAGDNNTVGPSDVNGIPVDPLIGWCLTYFHNFSGHPAISVPCGFTSEHGLPVGLQITGRRFDDEGVLAVAAAVERQRPWLHTLPCSASFD